MALIFNQSIKNYLSKGELIKCYVAVALCCVILLANISLFMFSLKGATWLAVLLSNAITVFLLLMAWRPISALMQNAFSSKAHELVEKEKKEEAMKERIAELEIENRNLESRIDTYSQTAGLPANIVFTSHVQTMVFYKSGYVVKEEPLELFQSDPQYGLQQEKKGLLGQLSQLVGKLTNPGEKRVLYIDKYSIKASLGLDFGNIYFCAKRDTLYLFGINITKLSPLPSTETLDDVRHCWLISGKDEESMSINQSEQFREFLDTYKKERKRETDETLETEIANLCKAYTVSFRESLTKRFPDVAFCDDMEDSSLIWLPLGEHLRDDRINRIATNMVLMATTIKGFFEKEQNKLLTE